jgi:hypothetical protein
MTLRKREHTGIDRGNTGSLSVQNSLWKRLGTVVRQTTKSNNLSMFRQRVLLLAYLQDFSKFLRISLLLELFYFRKCISEYLSYPYVTKETLIGDYIFKYILSVTAALVRTSRSPALIRTLVSFCHGHLKLPVRGSLFFCLPIFPNI